MPRRSAIIGRDYNAKKAPGTNQQSSCNACVITNQSSWRIPGNWEIRYRTAVDDESPSDSLTFTIGSDNRCNRSPKSTSNDLDTFMLTRLLVASVMVACSIFAIILVGRSANAASKAPIPAAKVDLPLTSTAGKQTAVFAGGCFWGTQAVFERVKGVINTTAGYAGGSAATATYDQVTTETTGHAESVEVVYDPSKITYGQLLRIFFSVAHDPTQLNRQGPDVGTSYRSAILRQ